MIIYLISLVIALVAGLYNLYSERQDISLSDVFVVALVAFVPVINSAFVVVILYMFFKEATQYKIVYKFKEK